MKPAYSLLLAAAILSASSLARAALFEPTPLDLQAEARAAASEHKRLAVLLTLPDCHNCKEMQATVYSDKAIEKEFGRTFRGVRLDISQDATLIDPAGQKVTPAEFATRLRAVGSPSFVFFDAQGKVLYRFTGKLDAAGFRQLTRYVRQGDYEHRPFVVASTEAASSRHAAHAAANAHQH